MYRASSAYIGVPGRQQAPHDVRTSEGQAQRRAHHPDILIMVLHGPQRITLQVYPSTNLSKSQIPRDADGAVTLDHVVARDNDVAAMREMAQSVRMPR
jgi:hypothetical protein